MMRAPRRRLREGARPRRGSSQPLPPNLCATRRWSEAIKREWARAQAATKTRRTAPATRRGLASSGQVGLIAAEAARASLLTARWSRRRLFTLDIQARPLQALEIVLAFAKLPLL